MGKKWTEVDVYTGLVKKEDAPTNATGVNVAGTGDDSSVVVVKKKKKKTLIDARSKKYKEHRRKLEQARQRRLARQEQSNLVKKVKENIGEFNREQYLEEDNVANLRDIVKRKSAKSLKFKDGSMKVDLFTASAIVQILDKVKPETKNKMISIINNGTKSQIMKLQQVAMKAIK